MVIDTLPDPSMYVNMSAMTDDSTEPICCPRLFSAPLSEPDAAELAALLKALADPARLRLVSIVAASATGEVCACDLTALIDRSQPTVSHHLTQLVKAGILRREQRGRWAWFRLGDERLQALGAALATTPLQAQVAEAS
jgi:ArsR family transcriptional regulator, arsenate/arsenite/antimonite-responsive transcriptional repressor